MQRKLEQTTQFSNPGRAIDPETARPTASDIAALAHELWKSRGCPDGSPDTDWFQAEAKLLHGEDQTAMAA